MRIFYCYSRNLVEFLKSNNIKYISSSINKKSNKRYWTFQKGEELDFLLNQWKANKILAIEYIKENI